MGSVAEWTHDLSYSDKRRDQRKSSQDSKWSKMPFLFIHHEVKPLNRFENSRYTLHHCKFFQYRTKWPRMTNRLGENQSRIVPTHPVKCGEIETFGIRTDDLPVGRGLTEQHCRIVLDRRSVVLVHVRDDLGIGLDQRFGTGEIEEEIVAGECIDAAETATR